MRVMGLTRICWGVPNHRVVPPSVLELQGRLAPTVIDDGFVSSPTDLLRCVWSIQYLEDAWAFAYIVCGFSLG